MALFDVNRETSMNLDHAKKLAKHALEELERIDKGGILDEERLTGIRSELLHAGLNLTSAMDDEDTLGYTIEALREVDEHGSGYPM